VTEGYNGTVFAYGQTGCGKSFSMQGISKPASQRGIIPRAFEHMFEAIAATANTKFLVRASYLEIYNEEIRDLLGADVKKKLELKESNDTGVYVCGLSMLPVHNVSECEKIMEKGWKSRAVGATLMNADSSRSHSIFTVYLERVSTLPEEEGDENSSNIRKGKLNLVDLAGSERQAKTGATGDRLKEATKINLSLSALGNVISALVDGKSKHIPYRDSKLTRLLQDSLGGNTKTLMIACLSPADNNYDESLSTLRYANRAKNIKNKPKVNEDPKDALVREYQEEIKRLKSMIADPNAAAVTAISNNNNHISLKEGSETEIKIKQEYDRKMQELIDKFKQEQESNEKLKSEMTALKESYSSSKSAAAVLPANASEAIERLAALEDFMVGGEKANDPELSEKRAKRKRIAEKKINAISEALKNFDNDDQLLLKAYGDITEELRARTVLLKKAKKKIISLEREVSDLQSEFEQDRTDYLETIRRLEQQVKLFSQVLDKIQPCIRRDCNYANIDRIKSECVWDEDIEKWRLPDLIVTRTKLPPPSSSYPDASPADHSPNSSSNNSRAVTAIRGSNHSSLLSSSSSSSGIFHPPPIHGMNPPTDNAILLEEDESAAAAAAGSNNRSSPNSDIRSSPEDAAASPDAGDKLYERLEKGMNENLAANYFKSKRRDVLLSHHYEPELASSRNHPATVSSSHPNILNSIRNGNNQNNSSSGGSPIISNNNIGSNCKYHDSSSILYIFFLSLAHSSIQSTEADQWWPETSEQGRELCCLTSR
jgi:kinesin family protein 3/17